MSMKSAPYYWLACDWPGCVAESGDDDDYRAYSDVTSACDMAAYCDWRTIDGKDYCPRHWHDPSDEESDRQGSDDPIAGPEADLTGVLHGDYDRTE